MIERFLNWIDSPGSKGDLFLALALIVAVIIGAEIIEFALHKGRWAK